MLLLGGPNGNSWEQIKIIIDPIEFVEVINDFSFYLFKCDQIGDNYTGLMKDALFEDYSRYWENIVLNENKDLKFDKSWFCRYIITDNSNDIEIVYHKQNRNSLVKEIMPVIWIDPFSFLYNEFRLVTNEFFVEGSIGINFIFPKKYGYLNDSRIDYYDSELLTNYQLYKSIRESLLKRVKQIRVLKERKIFRPDVYISDKAKERINSNCYLRKNGLRII